LLQDEAAGHAAETHFVMDGPGGILGLKIFFFRGAIAAGDDERKYSPTGELRKNLAKLAMTNHRFAADQRDMERLVLADELQNALHYLIAAAIVEPHSG